MHPLLLLLKAYKLFISPCLGVNCRFVPTCSEYAAEAIKKHGNIKGAWLGCKRLCRCHPLGGHGVDPVPE